jgi:Ca2+-binding RTX toxin-like protein
VGANTITAGAGNNYIIGGSGIDTITAMGGNNYIDAGSAANTVTTGLGHDIIITGDGIDTITSGDGNDIIINVGAGADVITAGGGHDRLISDFSTSTAAVNTAITGAESYGGTVGTATISGVEEFHITGGSGNDNIVTGDGADVLDGGAGADNLSSGRGSDVIYGGVGDTVSGGEDLVGDDFDVLVLKDFGPYEIVRDVLNAENGTIYQLDALGARVIGAEVIFTNIEHIEFVDPTVTTLEDTALTGNLFTTVATFTVGSTTYVAGQTAERTEGDLTINLDGSYIFSKRPAPPPCRA